MMLDDKDNLIENEEIVEDQDELPAITFTQVTNAMQVPQEQSIF